MVLVVMIIFGNAMAAPGMAAPDLSYFADFEQVKNLIVILLTLNKLKKINKKTPLRETGCVCILFWPWPYVTSTPHWLLRPVSSTPDTQLFLNA